MNRIEIRCGWREKQEKIGDIYIENARGKEVISFSFGALWLKEYPDFFLDPDIYNMPGRQYPPSDKTCFGFLQDIAPDRWGRKLMDRREVIDAKKEARPIRKLLESDYILGVHDKGRTGGIRLWNQGYLSDRNILAAPPMTELRKLEHASIKLESSDDKTEEKWFRDLIEPGSSLGGARPKANVTDERGNIWIAKFPSKNDDTDIGAWEMVTWELGKLCDIDVPEAKLMKFSENGSTFLTKRFDRNGEKRIHFASAMTMLGETDGSDSLSGYLDIAGAIERIGSNPDSDLKELWKRIVFNMCVTNADDHLRNHGFLLEENGWKLSPAFDVNPAYDQNTLSLLVGDDNSINIENALRVSEYFRLSETEAVNIVEKFKKTVSENWRKLAEKYKIPIKEQDLMRSAFENV